VLIQVTMRMKGGYDSSIELAILGTCVFVIKYKCFLFINKVVICVTGTT
jgi:hypothetical protein